MAYINPRFIPTKEETERERRQKAFQAQLLAMKRGPMDLTPYRRRQDLILQGGQQATAYESMKANQRQEAEINRLRNQSFSPRQVGVSIGQGQGRNFPSGQYANIPGLFGKFINEIARRESGGRYSAVNPDSGAMGKYQIMPGNLGGRGSGWDYAALGYDVSRSQFMSSPKIQEAIAQYQLRKYYNAYGPWGAAVAWYAGPGALKYSQASLRRRQGKYSSIATYADSIMSRLGY